MLQIITLTDHKTSVFFRLQTHGTITAAKQPRWVEGLPCQTRLQDSGGWHGCSHALLETYNSIGTVLTIVAYSLNSGLSIQPGEAFYTEV